MSPHLQQYYDGQSQETEREDHVAIPWHVWLMDLIDMKDEEGSSFQEHMKQLGWDSEEEEEPQMDLRQSTAVLPPKTSSSSSSSSSESSSSSDESDSESSESSFLEKARKYEAENISSSEDESGSSEYEASSE